MKYNILFLSLLLLVTNKNGISERVRAKNRRNYYKRVEEKRILDNMDKMQLVKYYNYNYNLTFTENKNTSNETISPPSYEIKNVVNYISITDMFNLIIVVLCSLFTD